ncbi:MAG: hypothetical protein IT355_05585 [Gemmatimonadaceae bacterium]|nr:hypothetical protein [Gemmatimonadaceae bacterium]
MGVIILEGVLFVAAIVAFAAFLLWGIKAFTPLGTRLRQADNRRLIDQHAALTCPIHGWQAPDSLVRLPSGEPLCSKCYQETLYGQLDR